MAREIKQKKPVKLLVIRLGKTNTYDLADHTDWALLFDNAVLEIKATDGAAYYWPLDSITLWKVAPHE